MVTVFPGGADSCSQLTSDRVVRQVAVSTGDPRMPPSSMAVHRHRDHHRHHHGSSSTFPGQSSEQPMAVIGDRKIRREIANHNERKRMQSINAGFQSLRTLLPQTSSSSADRLSKAAILQHAVEYISYLMHERQQLIELNRQCMAAGVGLSVDAVDTKSFASPLPLVKRRKSSDGDDSSSDDGLKSSLGEVAPMSKGPVVAVPTTVIIRDRLKRRLPSQETTVDCSSTEQVAPSLQQSGGHVKEEMAVSSSDDPMSTHHLVSSSTVTVPPSVSSRTCLSVSRRNLETIVEAIRHLEGESFYSDELSSVQSGGDSDRDSDRDDLSAPPLYAWKNIEPFALLTAAAACSGVPSGPFSLLRSELFQQLSSAKKC